jgi:tRNA-2-methylthio-N6-dimethylallyladenosine synthase
MTRELLQAVRDLPKCSTYLHVPLQSGSNAVLARMKRGHTVEQYREMMASVRELLPGAAVSSDFIVGFCGETEADFQASVAMVQECRFKNSYIFKYSLRPGTKAAERLLDDVPEDVKRRRNAELLALQDAISEQENQRFVGQSVEVLVEGPSKKAGKSGDEADLLQLTGRTMCDRIVVFDGPRRMVGEIVPIVIHDCTAHTLIGSPVRPPLEPQVFALVGDNENLHQDR